eukprot:42425_1
MMHSSRSLLKKYANVVCFHLQNWLIHKMNYILHYSIELWDTLNSPKQKKHSTFRKYFAIDKHWFNIKKHILAPAFWIKIFKILICKFGPLTENIKIDNSKPKWNVSFTNIIWNKYNILVYKHYMAIKVESNVKSISQMIMKLFTLHFVHEVDSIQIIAGFMKKQIYDYEITNFCTK